MFQLRRKLRVAGGVAALAVSALVAAACGSSPSTPSTSTTFSQGRHGNPDERLWHRG